MKIFFKKKGRKSLKCHFNNANLILMTIFFFVEGKEHENCRLIVITTI